MSANQFPDYTTPGLRSVRAEHAARLKREQRVRSDHERVCGDVLKALRQIDAELFRRETQEAEGRQAKEKIAESHVLEALEKVGFASGTNAREAIQQAMLDVVSFGTGTLALKLTPAGVETVAIAPTSCGAKVSPDDGETVAVSPKAWKDAHANVCAAAGSKLEPKSSYAILQEAICELEMLLAKRGHPRVPGITRTASVVVEIELLKLHAIRPDDGERTAALATSVAWRMADFIRKNVA